MKKDWMIKVSELDDLQLRIFNATHDKSSVISGCAGSGKSVLALIKAKKIQDLFGNNYIIIVFTRALCDYMESGREILGLDNPFYTHEEWKNKGCPRADYIIVDEIQDFNDQEILQMAQAARKNFYFFGDTAQSIYNKLKSKTGNMVDVNNIPTLLPQQKIKAWPLYYNHRLPLDIARFTHEIGVDLDSWDESAYRSKEKNCTPKVLSFQNQQKQLEFIHTTIQNQFLDDVAILVPKNELVKKVYDQMTSMGDNCETRYRAGPRTQSNLNFSTDNPKIMTYHSSKGLQFETVFLPFMEEFTDFGDARNALYVAATRSWKNLHILYSGELPGIFQHIDKNLYRTEPFDEINDI